jgi:hypothetical protein
VASGEIKIWPLMIRTWVVVSWHLAGKIEENKTPCTLAFLVETGTKSRALPQYHSTQSKIVNLQDYNCSMQKKIMFVGY